MHLPRSARDWQLSIGDSFDAGRDFLCGLNFTPDTCGDTGIDPLRDIADG